MDGDDRALQPKRSARAAGASRGAEQGHRGRRVRNCERAVRLFSREDNRRLFFSKKNLNQLCRTLTLSWSFFSNCFFFPPPPAPRFLPFHRMGTRSGAAVLPLLAGLVLLCSATRAQVSVLFFSTWKLGNGKIVRADAASKACDVSSPALEEEGGVFALCSCLLCREAYGLDRPTEF